MQRRRFVQGSVLLGAGIGCATAIPGVSLAATEPGKPLLIPPLLQGDGRTAITELAMQVASGQREFLSGLSTPTLGINGDYLGPTLRMRRDETVQLSVANQLAEPTTLHWHGLHIPPSVDGGPHQLIQPGDTWRPSFKITQRAGTFWYHSHVHQRTGDQVYRGLAGLLLVEDGVAATRGLPSEYGVDDIPLILQDRRFNEDGSFRYIGMHRDIMMGVHGDTMLVNGTVNPHFAASSQKIRFRILNACNARSMVIGFSDQRAFQLVGNDGGLLQEPVDMRSFTLSPSERAEIVVDVADGAVVELLGNPLPGDSPFASTGMMAMMSRMNRQQFSLLRIEPNSRLQASAEPAKQLVTLERLQESGADHVRRFTLSMMMGMGGMGGMGRNRNAGNGGGSAGNQGSGRGPGMGRGMMSNPQQFSINGESMDMSVINERIALGSTEIWEIHNDSMMMHPFHIHDGQFQVLSRNGRPPSAMDLGDKDTVKVGPGETVRLIKRFLDFADPEAPYMYHCHILEHEDNGMMGQYVVV